MNAKLVDTNAAEIYRLMSDVQTEFKDQGTSCKAFYRKIARWHMKRMDDLEKTMLKHLKLCP